MPLRFYSTSLSLNSVSTNLCFNYWVSLLCYF